MVWRILLFVWWNENIFLWKERDPTGMDKDVAKKVFNEILKHRSGHAWELGYSIIPKPWMSSPLVNNLLQQVQMYKKKC